MKNTPTRAIKVKRDGARHTAHDPYGVVGALLCRVIWLLLDPFRSFCSKKFEETEIKALPHWTDPEKYP